MPHAVERDKCPICGKDLQTRPWMIAVTREDGKNLIFKACTALCLVILCDWIKGLARSGRLEK